MSLSVAGRPILTSFCVTVSMIVPKAGMVDILTELIAAGEQDNTFRDQAAAGSLFVLERYFSISALPRQILYICVLTKEFYYYGGTNLLQLDFY